MTAGTVSPVSLHPRARREPPFSNTWFRYAASVLAFFLIFTFWQVAPVPFNVHIVVVAVAALSMFPLALWRARKKHGVPMFELVCVAYGVQYTIPIYQLPNLIVLRSIPVPFSWDEIQQTEILVFIGIGCMIAAYYGFERYLGSHVPQASLTIPPSLIGRFTIFGIGAGLLPHIAEKIGYVAGASITSEVLRVLSFQSYVGLTLLAYSVYSGRLQGRKWKYFLAGTVVGFSLLGLSGGLLEDAFIPLAILFIVRWQVRRKLPVHWLAIGLIAFVILNGAKADYRNATWFAGGGGSLQNRLLVWATLVQHEVVILTQTDFATQTQSMLTPAVSRLDLLHQFALMRRLTPAVVPYYNGSTYEYLFFGWIPRFVWTDKPSPGTEDFVMAQAYGLYVNGQTGYGTSIGIGHLNETYANFGLFGVIFLMSMHGFFYATMKHVFDDTEANGSQAIYLAVMVFFLNGIGSSTSLLVSGAVENSLVSSVILRLSVPRLADPDELAAASPSDQPVPPSRPKLRTVRRLFR